MRHRGRWLTVPGAAELAIFHRRHLDVQVDAVEERARRAARCVLRQLVRRAATAAQRVAAKAAGARVHRGDQHEMRRIRDAPAAPRDRDPAVLERLAEAFEHVAAELGELVEKEDAVVRERELAWTRTALPPPKRPAVETVWCGARNGRSAIIGRSPRRPAALWMRVTSSASANDERRQQRRQPPRQHRLARAGWPDEQEVVAAGGGDLERALGVLLAPHLGEVEQRRSPSRRPSSRPRLALATRTPLRIVDGLAEWSVGMTARSATSAASARSGAVRPAGRSPAARAAAAIASAPRIGRTLPSSASSPATATPPRCSCSGWPVAARRASAIGKVVGSALLAEMGGSEVHGDAAGRDLEAGVAERGPDAVLALADARVRETHGLACAECRSRGRPSTCTGCASMPTSAHVTTVASMPASVLAVGGRRNATSSHTSARTTVLSSTVSTVLIVLIPTQRGRRSAASRRAPAIEERGADEMCRGAQARRDVPGIVVDRSAVGSRRRLAIVSFRVASRDREAFLRPVGRVHGLVPIDQIFDAVNQF